jgi:hypothetical protein
MRSVRDSDQDMAMRFPCSITSGNSRSAVAASSWVPKCTNAAQHDCHVRSAVNCRHQLYDMFIMTIVVVIIVILVVVAVMGVAIVFMIVVVAVVVVVDVDLSHS